MREKKNAYHCSFPTTCREVCLSVSRNETQSLHFAAICGKDVAKSIFLVEKKTQASQHGTMLLQVGEYSPNPGAPMALFVLDLIEIIMYVLSVIALKTQRNEQLQKYIK